jgi:hypothetical protein
MTQLRNPVCEFCCTPLDGPPSARRRACAATWCRNQLRRDEKRRARRRRQPVKVNQRDPIAPTAPPGQRIAGVVQCRACGGKEVTFQTDGCGRVYEVCRCGAALMGQRESPC